MGTRADGMAPLSSPFVSLMGGDDPAAESKTSTEAANDFGAVLIQLDNTIVSEFHSVCADIRSILMYM